MDKKIILTLFMIFALGSITYGATETKAQNTAQNAAQKQAVQAPISTTSLKIVENPQDFLNKTVKMQATFDRFSTLGLDYSKAMRKSDKYIGILLKRDDAKDRDIPLSEMKLFLTKELAEKHIDLSSGDVIEITAKEFSTALGDPWLDVTELKVIKKSEKKEE